MKSLVIELREQRYESLLQDLSYWMRQALTDSAQSNTEHWLA
ncbi:hypothetical protein [Leptolyngbya sp. Heron Island J]|nr:hypothetical protein [Leptolyngbya sp. Heron Island J]